MSWPKEFRTNQVRFRRRVNRVVDGRTYYKSELPLPPGLTENLGWNHGDRLDIIRWGDGFYVCHEDDNQLPLGKATSTDEIVQQRNDAMLRKRDQALAEIDAQEEEALAALKHSYAYSRLPANVRRMFRERIQRDSELKREAIPTQFPLELLPSLVRTRRKQRDRLALPSRKKVPISVTIPQWQRDWLHETRKHEIGTSASLVVSQALAEFINKTQRNRPG